MATASTSNSSGKRKTSRQKHARAKTKQRSNLRRWSHQVMETSDAMDIEHDIFKEGNAQEIADSLKNHPKGRAPARRTETLEVPLH
jgi:Protein of unknown function (DUF3175)